MPPLYSYPSSVRTLRFNRWPSGTLRVTNQEMAWQQRIAKNDETRAKMKAEFERHHMELVEKVVARVRKLRRQHKKLPKVISRSKYVRQTIKELGLL